MDRERFEEIIDNTETNYGPGDNCLMGLNILAKYAPTKRVIADAEHDKIYTLEIDDFVEEISEEDAVKLATLGFGIDRDYNCLYHFV